MSGSGEVGNKFYRDLHVLLTTVSKADNLIVLGHLDADGWTDYCPAFSDMRLPCNLTGDHEISCLALTCYSLVSPFHPIRALPFNLTVNAPVIYPNYLTNDSTSQPITGIHTFDLPSVWLGDIALWLRTVESRFALRQITREDTKFNYDVAVLPMNIATDLRDIIDCPPTETPYTALKAALISRISLSTQKRLQR
ncbi:hypothetical protein SprV_0301063000 [Sparganum proliferum]